MQPGKAFVVRTPPPAPQSEAIQPRTMKFCLSFEDSEIRGLNCGTPGHDFGYFRFPKVVRGCMYPETVEEDRIASWVGRSCPTLDEAFDVAQIAVDFMHLRLLGEEMTQALKDQVVIRIVPGVIDTPGLYIYIYRAQNLR